MRFSAVQTLAAASVSRSVDATVGGACTGVLEHGKLGLPTAVKLLAVV